MTRRKRLTDTDVVGLPVKADRYTLPDPELRGHYIRVSTGGGKSFWAAARDPDGRQHWRRIGAPPMPITEAREKALAFLGSVRTAAPDSFEAVAEQWLKRHVQKNKLRSGPALEAFLRLHILPAFKGVQFASVRRKDITRLLDHLEDNHGSRQADYALSVIRQICNWQAARDDTYNSPIVRGMQRHGVRKRDRVLSDDELRAVWAASSRAASFGCFVKVLLLTGQRKDKVASMKWSDVADGVWNIDTEEGEKGNGGSLALPQIALDVIEDQRALLEAKRQIIGAQRVADDNPYVFAGRARSYSTGYSESKRALDSVARIAPWTLHDLRRTARSLMSAAGVHSDIAERVMGHVIGGVEGVYDRHEYKQEKAEALLLLANRITSIVTPPPDNVEQLRKAG